MDEKIELIKQIVKHHPALGTDKGWSTYTGGMADTGYWYWDKMIDVSEYDLQKFLLFLTETYKKVEEAYRERERIFALPKEERDAIYKKEQEEQRNLLIEYGEIMEKRLLWGK